MEGVFKEILTKKKACQLPKKKTPSPPPLTKIVSKNEATKTPYKSFVKEQVVNNVKNGKTSASNPLLESHKENPALPYTIQRNVYCEINTKTDEAKTLCEPIQDVLKRSPTDCVYHISANVSCCQNAVPFNTTPLAQFTGNVQSLEVRLPTHESNLKIPSVLYATQIRNSRDKHNHMVYDSTKTPLGKVTPPPKESLYDPGSCHYANTRTQMYPTYNQTNFSPISLRFSRYELCHDKRKPISTTNESFLNTSRRPNLYAEENYPSASCKSVMKEPFGPHTLDNRLGHSPWNKLERQANPSRFTSYRPNETQNSMWKQKDLPYQRSVTQSTPVSHTNHFYPMRGNPHYTFRGGLTTYKKTPYQSLSDMATYYSNLEYEDQQDVISLLLSCRSLEKKIEEQHAIIDLLDHDLAEARKTLTLPPGLNKINKMEIKKETNVEAFEALKNFSTTHV